MAKIASFEGIAVSGLSSGEGLIERIKDGETEDKRLLVTETEFTSVMARSRREGSTLAAVQRQAWDGRALSVLNRKQLKASASHVAIIGHITPREFRIRLAESDLAGGTYNRYLPLYVERTRLLPHPAGVEDEIRCRARRPAELRHRPGPGRHQSRSTRRTRAVVRRAVPGTDRRRR